MSAASGGDQPIERGLEHLLAGRMLQAETIFRAILAREPNHPDALHLLGVVADRTGHLDWAAKLIARAVALRPEVAEFRRHLGNVLLRLGKTQEAAPELQRAIELGSAEALEAPAVAAATHNDLGKALHALGRMKEAERHYRRAIEFNGELIESRLNLARILQSQRRYDEAIAEHQRAIELNEIASRGGEGVKLSATELAEANANLGYAQKAEGLLDDAIASYRRAMELEPANASHQSNLCVAVNYHPDYTPDRIVREVKSYAAKHIEPLRRFIRSSNRPRDPGDADRRPLRIGYVSSDFAMHVCSRYFLTLLTSHDPRAVDVVCYSNVVYPDAMTQRIRERAPAWRDISRLSDEQAAELIRQDRIDILVDLNLHTADNRLPLFGHKPAPVQASWLGYPGTTGLPTTDYRISDVHMDPPNGPDPFGIERVLPLPDCFWCFEPEDEEPAVNALPAGSRGYITFGSLNTFGKVNDRLLARWARVMQAVSGSHLLIRAETPTSQRRVTAILHSHGIEADRVEFASHRPRREYLEHYRRIDMGLDTWPYNGHVTSLDSFWMGVPVVTLSGLTPASRAGRSLLANLGLAELATGSDDQFVEIAQRLASDVPALAKLRASLRERMRASPLMDKKRFARNMEAAYRTMWKESATK